VKSLILPAILLLLLLFSFSAQAGFPEGENGYDLKKLEILLDYLVIKLEITIV